MSRPLLSSLPDFKVTDKVSSWTSWIGHGTVLAFMLSGSVPSDSLTPGTAAHQAPVHGMSQARVLGWAAITSSRGSSLPKGQTCTSCIAGGFFTTESPGKPARNCRAAPEGKVRFPGYKTQGRGLISYLKKMLLFIVLFMKQFMKGSKSVISGRSLII